MLLLKESFNLFFVFAYLLIKAFKNEKLKLVFQPNKKEGNLFSLSGSLIVSLKILEKNSSILFVVILAL